MKFPIATIAALLLSPAIALAQDAQAGAALYDQHCAVCHGADGRGKGPLAAALILQPPSLRDLSERHDGFPTRRVVMRIDGSDPLVSHGSPMPVYGEFFAGDDTILKTESGQPVMTSRAIVDLVAYLRGIQE
ncbi:cytochrome c [Sulfitobacter sp. S223]|uniref:c-type cytochrome n=1 Tax=Sulfitobacter sp. S223 TaxID=2867023 RepID=UPI0021A8C801|nr:cytochrome c [Sulfitobacter sp. S223]UWR25419.1 cytochrome c [Sulfitobacter sp. S223]